MIRRRLMLLAAPLCVVMVAASVAFASTTDTEHTIDAKLDDPHVVRPIAASSSDLAPVMTAQRLRAMLQHQNDQTTKALVQAGITAEVKSAVAAELQAAANRQAVAVMLELTTPVPQTGYARLTGAASGTSYAAPAPSGGQSGGGAGGALACIRAHESDSAGGYQAVSSGGTYRGAYQFLQGTWDNSASAAGRADLVGVDPASASPADQDAVASYLYSTAGSQPWGGRC